MYESRIKSELCRKYRTKHFLAWTERGRECLWSLGLFILGTAMIAYFGSHFLVFITGGYEQPIGQIIIRN